ncbi:expressed unknown protein [Seminavis robusta]|uniref:Thioredoxin-like fold domain-containing protein n=1 Tax=Seminavis robusta TaxID=568900 RepID=A0A9N8EHB5_9STRA|nr:expressed unknown protein [Seminavis robusta]|eukprot:Sro1167_g248360.1 n/a (304) ;mRNA; r:11433-12490
MTRKLLLSLLLLTTFLLGAVLAAPSQSSSSDDDDDSVDEVVERDGEAMEPVFQQAAAGGGKVKVQFYGESQCPFCRKFVTETWNDIWSDNDLKALIDYEYVPWGNSYFATEACGKGPYSPGERACFYDHCIYKLRTFGADDLTTDDDCFKGDVVYQHSEKEGQVDIYESCIIQNDGVDKAVAFTYCAEGDLMDNTEMSAHELLMECAADADIDVAATQSCADGQGRDIEIANAKKTPAHPGVPYVLVEGIAVPDANGQTKLFLCQKLAEKGHHPSACSSNHSDRLLEHGTAGADKLWWKQATW